MPAIVLKDHPWIMVGMPAHEHIVIVAARHHKWVHSIWRGSLKDAVKEARMRELDGRQAMSMIFIDGSLAMSSEDVAAAGDAFGDAKRHSPEGMRRWQEWCAKFKKLDIK